MDTHPCQICGTEDQDKPMCFRYEPWCCQNHRHMVLKVQQDTSPDGSDLDE